MRNAVKGTSGNARLVTGPYALGNSIGAPVFEAYEGTVTSRGQELAMKFYIAWNYQTFTCQLTVFLAGSTADAANIEPEFVAMIRTLK